MKTVLAEKYNVEGVEMAVDMFKKWLEESEKDGSLQKNKELYAKMENLNSNDIMCEMFGAFIGGLDEDVSIN